VHLLADDWVPLDRQQRPAHRPRIVGGSAQQSPGRNSLGARWLRRWRWT